MISINWATKIITVPRTDLVLDSAYSSAFSSAFGTSFGSFGPRYTYDLELFRLELKDLEDDEEGINNLDTHKRNAPVTLSGVTYAQTIEMINGYTVLFEDGNYSVALKGANHNIGDVKVVNSVSVIIGNSAGLIVVDSGVGNSPSDVAAAVRVELAAELAKIAALMFTVSGLVDVNVERMNTAEVIGTGTDGDSWRGVGVSP